MGIKLKTEEGAEFSFDTVAEFMEFKKQIDEEEASKEPEIVIEEDTSADEEGVPEEPKFEVGDKVRVVENKSAGHIDGTIGEITEVRYVRREDRWSYVVRPISGHLIDFRFSHKESDLELYGDEGEVEVGDKVRIVSSDDGTDMPYHYHDVGSVGKVVSKQRFGRIEVEVDGETQYLLPHHYEDVKVVEEEKVIEEEQEFKVGDLVRVIGNSNGHRAEIGEVLEIKEVDSIEPKYNLSKIRNGYWASTSDIEHVHSSPKFRTGDIVRVTESFTDHFGDLARRGAVYSYDENFGFAEPFVGTVFLGDNIDKLVLVCRDEDRLDI